MFFGAPAKPMPEIMANAIGQVVAQVSGIIEAYLPQCYLEGDNEARQVLVIGVDSQERIQQIMPQLIEKMKLVMPPGQFIDIIPFPSSTMPPAARVRDYQIFKTTTKPWWKIW